MLTFQISWSRNNLQICKISGLFSALCMCEREKESEKERGGGERDRATLLPAFKTNSNEVHPVPADFFSAQTIGSAQFAKTTDNFLIKVITNNT